MVFSTEDATTLAAALSGIERRLAVRRLALGGAIGAALVAPVIALASTSPAAGVLLLVATVAAAGIASRLPGPSAVRWLDQRTGSEDLIASGAALLDGSARSTALAGFVVAAAASKSHGRRPSRVPSLVAASIVAGLIGLGLPAITQRGATPASTAPTISADEIVSTEVAIPDSPIPAVPAAHAQTWESTQDVPTAAGAPTATAGLADDGRLAGNRSAPATATAERGHRVVARAATLDSPAPHAGTSPAILAVPARYRALVTAFLEAR